MLEVSEELKKAFMADNVEKQYRITFPDGDHETITNEQIVANSVNFTESLCSKNTLKFGLCEANVFKCTAECEDIKGCEIEVFIDAYYNGEVYTVPYGGFTVESCKRQAGTKLRNIEAYTVVIGETYPITELEKEKRLCLFPINKPYKVDLLKTLISMGSCNIENFISNVFNEELKTRNRTAFFLLKQENAHMIKLGVYFKIHYLNISNETSQNLFRFKYNINNSFDIQEEARNIANKVCDIANAWTDKYGLTRLVIDKDSMIDRIIYDCNDTSAGNIVCNYLVNNLDYNLCNIKVKPNNIYYPFMGDFNYNDDEYGVLSKERLYEELRLPSYEILITAELSRSGKVIDTYEETRGTAITNASIDNISIRSIYGVNIILDRYLSDGYTDKTYVAPLDNIDMIFFESFCELNGLFAKAGRKNKLDLININSNFARYPEENIFPSGDIYPVIGKNYQPLTTTSYKAADYEEYKTHKYGYVRVTYLATDNEKYSITVECDSNFDNVYDMTRNEIFLSKIWTAEQVKQAIKTYFYPNIKDIEYNPANVSIKGLPFIEAGDLIKVYADNGTFKTFVLRRTLKGEQVLTDTIDASGEERHKDSDLWISVAGQEERA